MKINLKELEKLIKKSNVAFISSVDEEGIPNTKAMLPPRKTEGLKTFYFSTNTSSVRTRHYRQNPKACIYFYQKKLFRFWGIMLKGQMEVLEDEATKKLLWQTGDKIYYPQGVTDPDYCVLKFTATEGRYYCNLETGSFGV